MLNNCFLLVSVSEPILNAWVWESPLVAGTAMGSILQGSSQFGDEKDYWACYRGSVGLLSGTRGTEVNVVSATTRDKLCN